MNNMLAQTGKEMLADLNEVQMDLALSGQSEVSEKIRKVKHQMIKMTESGGNEIDALVSGYRNDALDQCERVKKILARIGQGESPSDNELIFLSMASELLVKQIGTYLQRKMWAQCPRLAGF